MVTTLKSMLSASLIFLVAPIFMALAAPSPALACFKDWTQATKIVEQEGLVTVSKLNSQFGRLKLGDIVKTELCHADGQYFYRLVVRTPNGRFRSTLYDATRGIEIGVADTSK